MNYKVANKYMNKNLKKNMKPLYIYIKKTFQGYLEQKQKIYKVMYCCLYLIQIVWSFPFDLFRPHSHKNNKSSKKEWLKIVKRQLW